MIFYLRSEYEVQNNSPDNDMKWGDELVKT